MAYDPLVSPIAPPRSFAGLRVAALALCLLCAFPVFAKKKEAPAEEPDKPRVTLDASTHHGFSPVTVTLTGQLLGVDPADPQYCHIGVEWEVTSPFAGRSSSKQDPRCLHPPEQVEADRNFAKIITLWQVGNYTWRLVLYRRDGEKLLSNTTEVRVLSPN